MRNSDDSKQCRPSASMALLHPFLTMFSEKDAKCELLNVLLKLHPPHPEEMQDEWSGDSDSFVKAKAKQNLNEKRNEEKEKKSRESNGGAANTLADHRSAFRHTSPIKQHRHQSGGSGGGGSSSSVGNTLSSADVIPLHHGINFNPLIEEEPEVVDATAAGEEECDAEEGEVVEIGIETNAPAPPPVVQYDAVGGDAQPLSEKFLPKIRTDDNLTNLAEVNEQIVLSVLLSRYTAGAVYSNVGDILVACNPFQQLQWCTLDNVVRHAVDDVFPTPHVYNVASAAYTSLTVTSQNQCCVISGESGAGKTETSKLFVKSLVLLAKKRTSKDDAQTAAAASKFDSTSTPLSAGSNSSTTMLEENITAINLILEAFGNANTVTNSNSSRYGQYLGLQFHSHFGLQGARVSEYLLESSRVVHQSVGEGNFHIFYYLLAGMDGPGQPFGRLQDYRYLSDSIPDGAGRAGFVDPKVAAQGYQDLVAMMHRAGFEAEEIVEINRLLATVLQAGNIAFEHSVADNDRVHVADSMPLDAIAALAMISARNLEVQLCTSTTITRGEKINKFKTMPQAEEGREALAKAVYGRLFAWIVAKLNVHLEPSSEKEKSWFEIGVLDLFGFEVHDTNSFEQLCINVANEQLQYFFNQHIFSWELKDYASEGIATSTITYEDNQDLLEQFFKKPMGLYKLLDEETYYPRATDETFRHKLHKAFKKFPKLVFSKGTSKTFVVQHFAGNVEYDCTGFLMKNRNALPLGIKTLLSGSPLNLLSTIFCADFTKTGSLDLSNKAAATPTATTTGGSTAGGGAGVGRIKASAAAAAVDDNDVERISGATSAAKGDDGWLALNRQAGASRVQGASNPVPLPTTKKQKISRLQQFRSSQKSMKDKKRTRNRKNGQSLKPNRMSFKSFKKALPGKRKKQVTRAHTVGMQFRSSLTDLMDKISTSEPHFVRCIKPNAEHIPRSFDNVLVLRQLQNTGIIETVRIRRDGFPVRLQFDEFLRRYQLLAFPLSAAIDPTKQVCTELLANLTQRGVLSPSAPKHFKDSPPAWVIGKTRVFMKQDVVDQLKSDLERCREAAVICQKHIRRYLCRNTLSMLKKEKQKKEARLRAIKEAKAAAAIALAAKLKAEQDAAEVARVASERALAAKRQVEAAAAAAAAQVQAQAAKIAEEAEIANRKAAVEAARIKEEHRVAVERVTIDALEKATADASGVAASKHFGGEKDAPRLAVTAKGKEDGPESTIVASKDSAMDEVETFAITTTALSTPCNDAIVKDSNNDDGSTVGDAAFAISLQDVLGFELDPSCPAPPAAATTPPHAAAAARRVTKSGPLGLLTNVALPQRHMVSEVEAEDVAGEEKQEMETRSVSFDVPPKLSVSRGGNAQKKRKQLRKRVWKMLVKIFRPRRKRKSKTSTKTALQAAPHAVPEAAPGMPAPGNREAVREESLNADQIQYTTLALGTTLEASLADPREQRLSFSMNDLLEIRAQFTPEPTTTTPGKSNPPQTQHDVHIVVQVEKGQDLTKSVDRSETELQREGNDEGKTVFSGADNVSEDGGSGSSDPDAEDDEPLPSTPPPTTAAEEKEAVVQEKAMPAPATHSAAEASGTTSSRTSLASAAVTAVSSSASTLKPPQLRFQFVVSPFIADEYWDLEQKFGQYADLPSGIRHLNRYHNVLPNPNTRVVLKEVGGDDTSSYINANYVCSHDGTPRAYVAAQGPKPDTVADFWRMAWETNSRAIIMVTGLVELGKTKCARYWPEVRYNKEMGCGDVNLGDINIAVLGGYRKNTYITSKIRLRRNGEERMIRHFWFDAWPDHGVPDRSDTVVAMLKSVRGWSNDPNHPWIVHCSAGIGRTGTFIAIDQGVHALALRQRVDTNALIRRLREQRGGMVQHLEQAEFVQRCLEEYASSGNSQRESFRVPRVAVAPARAAIAAPTAAVVDAARKAEKVQTVNEGEEQKEAHAPPPPPRRGYGLSALAALNQLGSEGSASDSDGYSDEDEEEEDGKENRRRSIDEGDDGRVPAYRQNELFRKETRRADAASRVGGRRGERERKKRLQRNASANAARDYVDQITNSPYAFRKTTL